MSNKVNWFKQPDWDYIQKKYPNEYPILRSYYGGTGQWCIVDCRKMQLDPSVNNGWLTVGPCKHGFGLMAAGLYVLASSDLKVGDILDYDSVYVVTLVNRWDNDQIIYRVTNTAIDVHSDLNDIKAQLKRIREIIKKEDTFKGCLRLY